MMTKVWGADKSISVPRPLAEMLGGRVSSPRVLRPWSRYRYMIYDKALYFFKLFVFGKLFQNVFELV